MFIKRLKNIFDATDARQNSESKNVLSKKQSLCPISARFEPVFNNADNSPAGLC